MRTGPFERSMGESTSEDVGQGIVKGPNMYFGVSLDEGEGTSLTHGKGVGKGGLRDSVHS